MNLPPLPTDNLYKFMAIGGIILTIYGHYILLNTIVDTHKEAVLFFKNKDKQMQQFKDLKEYTKQMEDRAIYLSTQSGTLSESTKESLYDNLTKMQDRLDELTEKSFNLESDKELLKMIFDKYHYIKEISNIFLIIGPMLTSSGFLLWYFKVQRYQDIILRKEAKSLRR